MASRSRLHLRDISKTVLLVALIAGAVWVYRLPAFRAALHPEGIARLRLVVDQWGWRGPVVFFAVYTLVVALGLPNLPLQLAAGAIFGFWQAFALILAGLNLGALGAFLLARGLGRRTLERYVGNRLRPFNRHLKKAGLSTMLLLRLTPLVPFNLINFAAGMSRLKLRHFIAADLIGLAPLTYVHVRLGFAASQLDLLDPASWLDRRVVGPLLIAAALAALTTALQIARRNRPEDLPPR